jgi:tetratricopeptide (TPR) repeat protein
MSSTMEKGRLLYQTKRYDLAQRLFEEELASNPEDGDANSYLALCLAHQERYEPAIDACGKAVAFSPENWFAYYAAAQVHRLAGKPKAAMKLVLQALAIDSQNVGCNILAAMLSVDEKNWSEALEWAEKALQLDPAEDEAQNVKALVYLHTGKTKEADLLLHDLLGLDPTNSFTLSNLGWSHLRQSQAPKALDFFSRALAEDPENGNARDGLMHALRSQYPMYGLVLRYFMWMSKFSTREQMAITFLSSRLRGLLEGVAREYPALRPVVNGLLFLWSVFDYLCWTARPITSLFLRFNKFGRRLLTQDEIDESTWVGLALALTGVFLGMHWWTGKIALKLAYIVSMTIVMPISDIYDCKPGLGRHAMAATTVVVFLTGLAGVWAFYDRPLSGPGKELFMAYAIGLLLTRVMAFFLNKKR